MRRFNVYFPTLLLIATLAFGQSETKRYLYMSMPDAAQKEKIREVAGVDWDTRGKDFNSGWVIPSLDLVFVRLGDGQTFPKDFEKDLVLKVLAAVEK